jgi:hypothetical protein
MATDGRRSRGERRVGHFMVVINIVIDTVSDFAEAVHYAVRSTHSPTMTKATQRS